MYDTLDKRNKCFGPLLDLTKTFDTIEHIILFCILEHVQVKRTTLNLLKSYLIVRATFKLTGRDRSPGNAVLRGRARDVPDARSLASGDGSSERRILVPSG